MTVVADGAVVDGAVVVVVVFMSGSASRAVKPSRVGKKFWRRLMQLQVALRGFAVYVAMQHRVAIETSEQ